MKKFARWYLLLLKAQLKRIDTWLAILAMIALTLVVAHINLPSVENVTVLVYAEDDADLDEIMQALSSREHVFDFVAAESEEALQEAVISGAVECGFALTPDFREVLQKKEQSKIVNFYCTTLSTKAEVAKESFYSGLLLIESEIWLNASLEDLYGYSDAELEQALAERQVELKDSAALFYIEEMTIDSDGNISEKASGDDTLVGVDLTAAQQRISARTHPVRGTVGLFLFLLVFLSVGRNLASAKTGFALYLSGRERLGYSVAASLAALTLPALVALPLLAATGGLAASAFAELCSFALFAAYSIAWCNLLAKLLRTPSRYMASLLAVLVLTLALCPVYIYIVNQVPVAAYLKWLLPLSVYL